MSWWLSNEAEHTTTDVRASEKPLPRRMQEWMESRKNIRPVSSWWPSAIYDLCPREMAMRIYSPKAEETKAFWTFRWDMGTAVHEWMQERHYGPMRVLLGNWICTGCGYTVTGKMPGELHSCKARWRAWKYEEPRFVFKRPHWKYPIVGRVDGELDDEPPPGCSSRRGLLELKTSNANRFPIDLKTDSLWPKYEFQIQLYLGLMDREWCKVHFVEPTGLFNPKKHGCSWDIPIQEIIVLRDAEILARALDKVERAEEFLKTITVPTTQWPLRICDSPSDYRAKRCLFAKECFDDVGMEALIGKIKSGGSVPVEKVHASGRSGFLFRGVNAVDGGVSV